jgi:hypothetical protein
MHIRDEPPLHKDKLWGLKNLIFKQRCSNSISRHTSREWSQTHDLGIGKYTTTKYDEKKQTMEHT